MAKPPKEDRPNASKLTRRQLLGIVGSAGATLAFGGGRSARADGGGDDGSDHGGPSLDTRLVTEYGARHPIVSAGMAFIGLTDLAVAVTNAGGIGVYGAAPEPPPAVDARLSAIGAGASGPFGVDFIIASSPLGDFTTQDHIDVVAAHKVPVVVFHWNLPPASWVTRASRGRLAGLGAGARCGHRARRARARRRRHHRAGPLGGRAQPQQHDPDAGAGGAHPRDGVARSACCSRRAASPTAGAWCARSSPAPTAAGWGRASSPPRSRYAHPEYQRRLAAAKGLNATAFTTAFGPEFPGAQQRVLRNTAVDNPTSTTPPTIGTTVLFPGVIDAPYPMPNHSAIVPTRDTTGDFDQMDMPAGAESVLSVSGVESAAEIIDEVVSEARDLLADGFLNP